MFCLNVTLFTNFLQLTRELFAKFRTFLLYCMFCFFFIAGFRYTYLVIVNDIGKRIQSLTPKNVQTLIVGWSGGIDSQALLAACLELELSKNYGVIAFHINHNLNPNASSIALELSEWARAKSISFRVASIDVRRFAKANRLSIEHAGRQLRYRALRDVQQETPDSIVLTAHHLEDRAETILMNIIKGTGTGGFVGIYPRIGDWLIRPLLGYSKFELEEIAKMYNLPVWEDKSNANLGIIRNRIRKSIIPEFNEINQQWMDKFVSCSNAISTDALMLDSLIFQALNQFTEDTKSINKLRYKFDPNSAFGWFVWDWGKLMHYLSSVFGFDLWADESSLRRVMLTLCRYLDLYIDQQNLLRVVRDLDNSLYPKRIQLVSDYWLSRTGRYLAVWNAGSDLKRRFEIGE